MDLSGMGVASRDEVEERDEVDYTRWIRDKMYYKTGLRVYLKTGLKSPFPLFVGMWPILLAKSENYEETS